MNVLEIITWTYPEPLMFLTSIATFWSCKKLVQENPDDLESVGTLPKKNVKHKYLSLLTSIGKNHFRSKNKCEFLWFTGRYGVLVTMCFAAIIVPSVFGALYFLIFLSSATWWACYKKLERKFAILIRCLLVIVFGHIMVLYAYQTQWPQELLPPTELIPRFVLFSNWCSLKNLHKYSFPWNGRSSILSQHHAISIVYSIISSKRLCCLSKLIWRQYCLFYLDKNKTIEWIGAANSDISIFFKLFSRIFGLIPLFSYTCKDPRDIIWVQHLWDAYAYPLALYLFYAISIFETRLLMKPQVNIPTSL